MAAQFSPPEEPLRCFPPLRGISCHLWVCAWYPSWQVRSDTLWFGAVVSGWFACQALSMYLSFYVVFEKCLFSSLPIFNGLWSAVFANKLGMFYRFWKLIPCVVWKPCPSLWWLPFHPTDVSIPIWKLLSLRKSSLSSLWDHSQESSLRPKARRVSLMSSLENFTVSGLIFDTLICFCPLSGMWFAVFVCRARFECVR